jgi:hypothetical protein
MAGRNVTKFQIALDTYFPPDAHSSLMSFANGSSVCGTQKSFIKFPEYLEYPSETDESTQPSTPPTPNNNPMYVGEEHPKPSALQSNMDAVLIQDELIHHIEIAKLSKRGVAPGKERDNSGDFPMRGKMQMSSAQLALPRASKKRSPVENKAKARKGKSQTQCKDAPPPLSVPLPPGLIQGAPGAVLSRGSKNHAIGQCRPCRSINTPGGCAAGFMCNFCHCPHEQNEVQGVYSKPEDLDECQPCIVEAKQETSDRVSNQPWYLPMPVPMSFPPGLEPATEGYFKAQQMGVQALEL